MYLTGGLISLLVIQGVCGTSPPPIKDTRNCPEANHFFPQLVDHSTTDHSRPNVTGPDIWKHRSSGSNATFPQQYGLNDAFYKPGGPILFWQGNEDVLACQSLMVLSSYAEQLGAMMVSLEHRYFGKSNPFGLNYSESPSWTAHDLRALTLDNVLHDTVNFFHWLKQKDERIRDAPVIVLGGKPSSIASHLFCLSLPLTAFLCRLLRWLLVCSSSNPISRRHLRCYRFVAPAKRSSVRSLQRVPLWLVPVD